MSMPPNAAITGNSAFRTFDNSPAYSSLSISRPIMRKKIAIRPSFTQYSTGWYISKATHGEAYALMPEMKIIFTGRGVGNYHREYRACYQNYSACFLAIKEMGE